MMRAVSAVMLSLAIASAFTAYTTKKTFKRQPIFWCVNTGVNDGPCRHFKSEKAV
jgi:hypothetical protein